MEDKTIHETKTTHSVLRTVAMTTKLIPMKIIRDLQIKQEIINSLRGARIYQVILQLLALWMTHKTRTCQDREAQDYLKIRPLNKSSNKLQALRIVDPLTLYTLHQLVSKVTTIAFQPVLIACQKKTIIITTRTKDNSYRRHSPARKSKTKT